ncbi:PIR protein CIR protein [Plasmodium vinckei petteri]|uniref:PIR protein CIR protein n=1 Tax=Plasmodium vinckei petteri TaxID=138298 RepID=A0A6V7SSA3_PLAVN|nr:PIR protein CIR protein [Plasmodium vinckei petteri]
MDDKVCDLLSEVDDLFTKGAVNVVRFNKFTKCHSYCPYENNSKKHKCKNDYERINALGSYLFKEIMEIDKAFKWPDDAKRHIEVFMIWLGDKLFKIENDYKSTLEESYKKNLEKHIGKVNYWETISKQLYKDATIKKMNEFYNLLSNICKLIIEYNTYIQNPQKHKKNRLGNYSGQCISYYRAIISSANECRPYLRLLDNLKMIYENFRMQKMDIYSKLNSREKGLLLNRVKHLTTFNDENKLFITVMANLSFGDKECVNAKSKDEKIGEQILSKSLQNTPKGTGITKKPYTRPQTKSSLSASQGKKTLPAPAKPPTAPRPRPQPQPQPQPQPKPQPKQEAKQQQVSQQQVSQSQPVVPIQSPDLQPPVPSQKPGPPPLSPIPVPPQQSTDTKQTDSQQTGPLPAVPPSQDGGSLQTPKTGEIHQNGQGGAADRKGETSSGSDVTQDSQGRSSGGSGDGQGSGVHGSGDAGGGQGASKSGQGSGAHGSGGTGVRSGDQAVKGSQEGISGGTSSGASGGQGSQGITSSESGSSSGGAGGGKGDAGSGGNGGGSAQGDQGKTPGGTGSGQGGQAKTPGGTGSGQGGQAKGPGDPPGGNPVPASSGTGTTSSPQSVQQPPAAPPQQSGPPPQAGGSNSQNESKNSGSSKGSTGDANGNKGDPSGGNGNPSDGSSDPASSTSGGSFDWSSSIFEFILKGKEYYNKASEFIEKNRQNFENAKNKINDAYNNTVDSLENAYNASSDYLNNFISNMTSQLNQFDPIPKSGGNQTGSGSPAGGGNPSTPPIDPQPPSPPTSPQITPPALPPNPIPNPIQDPSKGSLQQNQSPPQPQPITHKPAQIKQTNHQKIGQLVKSLSSDIILKKPWNIFPTTWNGSGDCKPEIKFMNATLVCCTSEQCSLTGILITFVLIPIILLIAYKYLSFGSSKKSEKKNMKRVINFHDGNRKTKIIISSNNRNKDLKPVINLVDGKKDSLLNIYKLIRADPMPFINLFFLLIFFVYKRKRNIIE